MCCFVLFGVTLRLLVINISSSSPAIDKLRRLLPAISVTTCGTVVRRRRVDNTWPAAALIARSEVSYRLRIAISAYPTCIRHHRYGDSLRNIAITKKLEWCGCPTVKKMNISLFVLTQSTNVTDTHTDRRTDTA